MRRVPLLSRTMRAPSNALLKRSNVMQTPRQRIVPMGHLRRSQNRLIESRTELELATTLDRNDARAFFQLGMTLMYLGRPEEAIAQIEKAMRLNPRDPNVAQYYWGLGACHLLLGRLDEAIDFLRRACAANPWHHFPPLHLA